MDGGTRPQAHFIPAIPPINLRIIEIAKNPVQLTSSELDV